MSLISNIIIFWDVTTCSSGKRNSAFGGKCYVQILNKYWTLNPEKRGTNFLRNVDIYLPDNTVLHTIATAVITSKHKSVEGFEQRNFPRFVTCANCGTTSYEVHVTMPPTPSHWPDSYAPHASCLLNSLLPVANKSGNRSQMENTCSPSAFIATLKALFVDSVKLSQHSNQATLVRL